MMKHTALATILGLMLIVPAAAAQVSAGSTATTGGTQARRPPIQRIVNQFRLRIHRGVRAGRITPQELSTLRSDIVTFRSHLQAKRQAGTPLTPAERQELRQELRRISRAIYAANHRK